MTGINHQTNAQPNGASPQTGNFGHQACIIIATARAASHLARQFALLGRGAPTIAGCILIDQSDHANALIGTGLRSLGTVDDLEFIIAEIQPDFAAISIPAPFGDLITSIRTRLRKLAVPDRFLPTLEDQLNGVGPRSRFEIEVNDLVDRAPVEVDESAISTTVRGKRVLITGAGGSIGSELARIVARYEPSEIFLMERSENALFEIDRQIARAHPALPRGAWLHDVTDAEKTLAYCIAGKPDVIFHTAAHKHVPMMEDHPALALHNNFFGTKSIADAAAQSGCGHFVMVSTDKAVNPSSVMGATKRLAEMYVQYMNTASDTSFEIVRFGNVLGSAGSVLTIWSQQVREGGPLTVTDPEMTRYFMTIPEAAALVVQAAALDAVGGGDIAVLDMGEPIGILSLAKRYIEMHGLDWSVTSANAQPASGTSSSRPKTESAPGPKRTGASATTHDSSAAVVPIIFTGIRPGEKLHEDLVYPHEQLQPSPHPGIHIWKSTPPSRETVADMQASLSEACACDDNDEVLRAIMRLVPIMQRLNAHGQARVLRTPGESGEVSTSCESYRTGPVANPSSSKVA